MQDKSQYELLMEEHQHQLRRFIFSLLPNHSTADDILQETNRILWEKRNQFTLGTNFFGWARTIARFQTLTFLKNSKSWLSFDSELVVSLAKAYTPDDNTGVQKSRALRTCINCLTESDKSLLQLRYNGKMSLREIGEATGRTEGALKQVFLRIRQQLKACVVRRLFIELDSVSDTLGLPPENPRTEQAKSNVSRFNKPTT